MRLFWIAMLLCLCASPLLAAVVPDGDNLPRDAGAPVLPGGRQERASRARPTPGSSPSAAASPESGTSTSGAVGSKASGQSSTGSPGASGGVPLPPPPQDGATPSGVSAGVRTQASPRSLYGLAFIVILFVAWTGWRATRSEGD